MKWILRRAAGMIAAPDREWRAVRAEAPRPLAVMLYVFLLSLLAAAGRSAGLWLSGDQAGPGGRAASSDLGAIAAGGVLTSAGIIVSVALSVVSMMALARLFNGERTFARALQVAAYSATPVLLAGWLLIQPDLMAVLIIASFHSVYLQYVGVQQVLCVKAGEAAEYVALSALLLSVLLTLAGGLASWLGVL